ncbi:CAAX amino protease [Philodulcilactobacillus myokoensis]|uniref:CAAX amino protease n=1 Tax=Philodulcilactobacillus myokoensis TaxID=2929573 RepID=A0A9W6B079_9LACO|nr:type II CAAX endopeptidase family protein [Philodulcilactobacillus myokoensis]GLB46078.1 CAAX amino protease [Philodulcilactobacillus myokoensis]
MDLITKILKFVGNFLLFIFLFFVIQIPTVGESFWGSENIHSYNLFNHYAFTLISFVVIFSILFWFYKKINGKKIIKQRITIKVATISLVLTIIDIGGQDLVQYILTSSTTSTSDAASLFQLKNTGLFLVLILDVVVISPIFEEILFRGILQRGILKKINPIVSAIITGILFGMLHSYLQPFSSESLILMVSGLTLSFAYYFTDYDLKSSILIHALSNLWVIISYLYL